MFCLPSLLPRGLATMFNVQPELGFNVSPAITPGFRVGLPEDLPGFRINQDGSVRRVSSSNAPAYGFNPYALNLSVAASPHCSTNSRSDRRLLSGDNCEL